MGDKEKMRRLSRGTAWEDGWWPGKDKTKQETINSSTRIAAAAANSVTVSKWVELDDEMDDEGGGLIIRALAV